MDLVTTPQKALKRTGLIGRKHKKMLVAELRNQWYKGSTGYDPAFLDNIVTVPLPKLRSDLEQDIALLKTGRTVLNYTHFSIVMSKSRVLPWIPDSGRVLESSYNG